MNLISNSTWKWLGWSQIVIGSFALGVGIFSLLFGNHVLGVLNLVMGTMCLVLGIGNLKTGHE